MLGQLEFCVAMIALAHSLDHILFVEVINVSVVCINYFYETLKALIKRDSKSRVYFLEENIKINQ